ncbi:MAG: PilZ domain-containing protein [Deltaproteobacteria bacterium]|nr:PilZ domain-containing protein [Deltaproteobacteria bacterium]
MSHSMSLERRASARVPTRLFIRGLGDGRGTLEELGDFSIGGVGFQTPWAPRVERFRVSFATPSSAKLKTATCELVGTTELERGYWIHLRYVDLAAPRRESLERLTRAGLAAPGRSESPSASPPVWRGDASQSDRPAGSLRSPQFRAEAAARQTAAKRVGRVPTAPKIWMSRSEVPLLGSAAEESSRLTRWILRLLSGEGFESEAPVRPFGRGLFTRAAD